MSKFGFGTPTTNTTNTTFGFGAQKQPTGFAPITANFGSTAPTGGSLSFGATPASTSTTSSFGFGATPSVATSLQSSSLFGTAGTSTTSVSSSLFSSPIVSAAPTGGLTFGTPASTGGLSFSQSQPVTSSVFGTAPATTAPSLFGTAPAGGLFGAKPVSSAAPTVTSSSLGLGGVDVYASKPGLTQGSSSPTAAKENLIPNELVQTIENFKSFIKLQKSHASDIARGSARPLDRCAEDTASLMELLTTLGGSVQRDRSLADKLKQDTAKALQNAEIAQRTHDTPPGLQYENNAPLLFFMELAESFEQDLMLFRSQIESTEKHIHTMVAPKTLTPQELTMAMSKLHESLIAVAGRLQGVHAKVQQQKEQYLNLRKYVLKDTADVFEDSKLNGKVNRISSGKMNSGPTPFSPGNKSFLSSTNLSSSRPPNYGTPNPLAWGSATPIQSASNIGISATAKPPTSSLNFNLPTNIPKPLSTTDSNSSFQLQKPPTGNKRENTDTGDASFPVEDRTNLVLHLLETAPRDELVLGGVFDDSGHYYHKT